MKKQTKVLVAAAMLTLGASFSAMAAEKGTWDKSTGEWMCYDKDGDAYEAEWCLYNGIEYWVNDDGVLGASEWVDTDDEYMFYAQSDGSKAKGVWKELYSFEDEDDEELNWYYFDAKGRMVKNEVEKINGKYYAFNADGEMLTGWVDTTTGVVAVEEGTDYDAAIANKKVLYFNEDGDRASYKWVECFEIGADTEDLYEGEHEVNYYITKDGYPAITKTEDNDSKLTYLFGTDGQMLSGWVGYTNATEGYKKLTESNAASTLDYTDIYNTAEEGYVQTSRWKKLATPQTGDSASYYYWFDKNGKLFKPATTDVAITTLKFVNGDFEDIDTAIVDNAEVAVFEKRIDGVKYYFNAKGEMQYGLFYKGTDSDAVYYYGENDANGGSMKTGAQVIEDADGYEFDFYFATETKNGYDKGVAVSGNADGYCYDKGLLQTSGESGLYKVVTVTSGKSFVVDANGKIQSSTTKKYELVDGSVYKFTFDKEHKGITYNSIATVVDPQ